MNINRSYTTTNASNTGDRGRKGVKSDYHWIVVHYVGACNWTTGEESTAKNNCVYYQNNKVGASANFYVDKTGVYQSVPWDSDRYAWHCGIGAGNENKYKYLLNDGKYDCNNATSIGVEICVCKKSVKSRSALDTDWYFNETTYNNAVEFVKYLMNYFGIDIDHVVRHYDVNTIHKPCPRPFVGDATNVCYNKTGNVLWSEFKAKLTASSGSSSVSSKVTTSSTSSATKTTTSSTSTTNTSVAPYRVRKTWADASSQKGSFSSLENAKKCADKYSGYSVFDNKGTLVYPVDTSATISASTKTTTTTKITTKTVCQAYKVNSSDGILNMRSTANSSNTSNIIKTLKNGEFVLASKEQSDGWLYVKYIADNKVYTGWVYKKYLTETNGLYSKLVNSKDGTLNIRANYNAKGTLLATMGNNFGFSVLKKVSGTNWGLIWCGETIGYSDISDSYSKKV
jgi:N-acetylmuramoyl-L-alanine amidase CwlA